jgi:heme/copper-type cytochrome/quinol oxidase subunit 2
MGISNFWVYTIMVVVILHVIVGFAYLLYKLSPKKKDKKEHE